MRVRVSPGVRAETVARPQHDIGGLTITRHAVILGITADGRTVPVLPDCAKRGRHAAAAGLDLKTFAAQEIDVPLRRPVLAPSGFGEIPDLPVPSRPV